MNKRKERIMEQRDGENKDEGRKKNRKKRRK